jgi:hypothetical protein
MIRKISLTWSRVLLSSVLTALLVWPPVLFAWTQPAVAFSGQATVLRVTTHGIIDITNTVSDTGPLSPSGGALQTSLLSVNFPGLLTADVAHATTIGQADRARSEASVADVSLTVGGNTIAADFLRSSAMAVCTTGGPAVSGSSEIADLVINGQPFAVSGQPNQTITLPAGGVMVIINEQSSSVSGNTGSITVNALHVIIPSAGLVPGVDVVVSSAHADVTCQGVPACIGKDFVTGGGFITGPASGAKGNFGVGGGIKDDGTLWGHLEYIDHGSNGPKVHGTGVTNYSILSATTRQIDGTAEVNGLSGFTYRVVVADNDQPGVNDFFSIKLFDSKSNQTYSAGGNLGGGEIQLHKPCH